MKEIVTIFLTPLTTWENALNDFFNASNGGENKSNGLSNASNDFPNRLNGNWTVNERFRPLNGKAFVYVFPWKVTFSPTALCGKDDSDERMKARQKVTKPPFLRARSSKAAKRKLKTQAARAETCKRRLFVDEEENQPVPILPEPHVLRERIQPELVRLYFKIELVWIYLLVYLFIYLFLSLHYLLACQELPANRTVRCQNNWCRFIATVIEMLWILQIW